jgi:hypothetical protein
MSERRDAIVRLLRTRDEHLPEPRHRTETMAGFVHRAPARISCPDCLANDKAMFGCETCGGRGYTEEHRERDPYAVDQVMPFGLEPDFREANRNRDRQIEILGQQLRPASKVDELEDANRHPYAWERARAAMYRRFDYGALDCALEQLRLLDDLAYRMLHSVHVYGWFTHITPAVEAICDRGIAFLDEQLPDPLRAPEPIPSAEQKIVGKLERAAGASARAIRDARICGLASQGLKPAEIAAECHVSIRTVYLVTRAAA